MQIKRHRFTHALSIEIHDEAVAPHPVVANLNGFFAQIDRAFVPLPVDREHIRLADLARLFDEEHFGRIGIVSQEFHAVAIQIEAIDRRHPYPAVELGIVFPLYPFVRQAIQFFKRRERGMQGQKAVPEPAKEALDLALGRAIADRRMGQMNVQPHASLQNFPGRVIRPIASAAPSK